MKRRKIEFVAVTSARTIRHITHSLAHSANYALSAQNQMQLFVGRTKCDENEIEKEKEIESNYVH